LVFGERINPYTGIPYLENSVIDDKKSVVEPENMLARSYTFIINHTLLISNSNALHTQDRNKLIDCKFYISLIAQTEGVSIAHRIDGSTNMYLLKKNAPR
jgi:hypothetical protein